MTEELLPCPMCAGKATLSKWESPIGVHEEVRCFKCGTSNPIVKFWNTRAQPREQVTPLAPQSSGATLKYKRVDLDEFKKEYKGGGSGYRTAVFANNAAIDDIKSEYGDLYVEVK